MSGRKYGRNKDCCATYKAGGQEGKNRKRRIVRQLRSNPFDSGAAAAYQRLFGTPLTGTFTSKGRKLIKEAHRGRR